jgi:hypothetical protein
MLIADSIEKPMTRETAETRVFGRACFIPVCMLARRKASEEGNEPSTLSAMSNKHNFTSLVLHAYSSTP